MNYELAGILITVTIQALYIAFKIGRFEEKLTALEKKQDRHNNLISRVYKAENDIEKAHLRIDFIDKEYKELYNDRFEK